MAERHRSKDKSRDTEKVLGEKGTLDQQGRTGGTLQRDIASRDERKRAKERPAGQTRVTGDTQQEDGGKGDDNA